MTKVLPVGRHGSVLPLLIIIIVATVVVFTIIFRSKSLNTSLNSQTQTVHSPDPFSSWKTYKNKNYSFTIRYPKELFVKEEPAGAADFFSVDPSSAEATPGAIIFRFTPLLEKVDVQEFKKIANLKEGEKFKEPIDVVSTITKIRSYNIADLPVIEFELDRKFSALEGPRGEHSRIIEINKDGTILKFSSSANDENSHEKFYEIFQRIISSFNP